MMLGELVGEERGKMTGYDIPSPVNKDEQKVQVYYQASGNFLGLEHIITGTYWSSIRPDGTVFAEGSGSISAKNGETGSWKGQGTGRYKEGGGLSLRGAIYFHSDAPTLKRANGCALIYEHEVDPQNNIITKMWEWK